MKAIHVQLPEQLQRDLDTYCRQRERSASDVVSESLRRYLATERFHALRRQTLPFAEAQGLLTDDDAFDAIS